MGSSSRKGPSHCWWSLAFLTVAFLISILAPVASPQGLPVPVAAPTGLPASIPRPVSAPGPGGANSTTNVTTIAAPGSKGYTIVNATCYRDDATMNFTCPGCLLNVNISCPGCVVLKATAAQLTCRSNRTWWPFGWRYWTTDHDLIRSIEGDEIQWAGVNWMGGETTSCVPYGLHKRSYQSYLDQMKSLRFNMIRYPISGSFFSGSVAGVNGTVNPDIWNSSCVQVLDKIIEAAFERGIRIIIDYHKVRADVDPLWGLWYDGTSPESTWINNLVWLAARYADNPTVVGLELFNAPHWSTINDAPDYLYQNIGVPLNWRYSAEQAARAIQEVNPDILICISGMQYQDPAWPGSDISRYRYLKVNVTVNPNKLIYTFQEFGPMTNASYPWFNVTKAPFFPANMPKLRENWWAFMKLNQMLDPAPIWLNAWGSKWDLYSPQFEKEQTWANTFVSYISDLKIPWTWHAWTSDDPVTGGILFDDYETVNENKTQIFSTMLYPYPVSPRDGKPNGPIRPPTAPAGPPRYRFDPTNTSGIVAPSPGPASGPASQAVFAPTPLTLPPGFGFGNAAQKASPGACCGLLLSALIVTLVAPLLLA